MEELPFPFLDLFAKVNQAGITWTVDPTQYVIKHPAHTTLLKTNFHNFHPYQTKQLMACHPFFTLFLLFLIFYCPSTSTIARLHSHRPHPLVDIRNDLPNKTNVQLILSCDKGSSFHLKPSHHHNCTLTVDQDFECTAMWSPWFTTWDAYHAKRDKGHHIVYWSVRKDGFYHSWDGSKWKLLEDWNTEW